MATDRGTRRVLLFYFWLVLILGSVVMYSFAAGEISLHTGNAARWIADEGLNFLNVVVGGLAMVGAIFTIHLNQTDLEKTIKDLNESKYLAHYGELDRLYFDLTSMSVEHPHLRQPNLRNEGNSARYDAYAYMAWNFIETLADRLFKDEVDRFRIRRENDAAPATGTRGARKALPEAGPAAGGRSGRHGGGQDEEGGRYLAETWEPTLWQEMRLHRDWWRTSDKRHYKPYFIDWVEAEYAKIDAAQQEEPAMTGRQPAPPAGVPDPQIPAPVP